MPSTAAVLLKVTLNLDTAKSQVYFSALMDMVFSAFNVGHHTFLLQGASFGLEATFLQGPPHTFCDSTPISLAPTFLFPVCKCWYPQDRSSVLPVSAFSQAIPAGA